MLGVISLWDPDPGCTHRVGSRAWHVSRGAPPLPVISHLLGTCQGGRRLSPCSWQSLGLDEIVGFSPALTLNSFLIY